jgi:threonine aldolase
VLWHAISPTQVRIVTHLDVSDAMVAKTIELIEQI